MGQVLADALGGELDVVLVHKLGAPGNPEYAIGSVSESGDVFLTEAAEAMGITKNQIAREVRAQMETLRRRRALYTPVRVPISPFNRIVIVVDNGIATGSTMIAALRAVRAQKPAKLIGTVAVAPPDTLDRIAKEADELIYLAAPTNFHAVGQFFLDFSQVSDEEVIETLKQASQKSQASSSS
jgi:predicted phosphoribosyltransferase